MQDLVSRITQTAGIDAATAEKSIAVIFGFLQKEAPKDVIDTLIANVPEARDALAGTQEKTGSGGLLGGMAGLMGGGGIMAVGSQLMALGLSMPQIQDVTREIIAYAREKAGDDTVNQLVASIPGLSQFV